MQNNTNSNNNISNPVSHLPTLQLAQKTYTTSSSSAAFYQQQQILEAQRRAAEKKRRESGWSDKQPFQGNFYHPGSNTTRLIGAPTTISDAVHLDSLTARITKAFASDDVRSMKNNKCGAGGRNIIPAGDLSSLSPSAVAEKDEEQQQKQQQEEDREKTSPNNNNSSTTQQNLTQRGYSSFHYLPDVFSPHRQPTDEELKRQQLQRNQDQHAQQRRQ